MRKIFVALIIIFVIILLLTVGLFVLKNSFNRICSLAKCVEVITIITDNKFSDDISILADGEVLLDLCELNETERAERLYLLYPPIDSSDNLKPKMYIWKENPHKVDIWQIMIQPDCIGSKQLIHEIKRKDVIIKETEPNGPGCGTCQNGIIDLSSDVK